jgi:ethanolamine utilization protein EutQ
VRQSVVPSDGRRPVVTSADIHAAHQAGQRDIVLPASAVVTPLARDVAAELGVTLALDGTTAATTSGRPGTSEPPHGASIEATVRRIVEGMLGGGTQGGVPGPVRHVDSRQVVSEPFPFDGPEAGMDVRVADVVTAEHGATMGVGFLSLTRGCFPWTLTYDEVEYVIEGELHLGTPKGMVIGRPGDILYVPRGTNVTFGTPSWARLLYVTYPADWAGGGS